jgi:hypothetical protein
MTHPDGPDASLLLLPTPKTLTRRPGALRLDDAGRRAVERLSDPATPCQPGTHGPVRLELREDARGALDEAYRLSVDERGVRIVAGTTRGLRMGCFTLAQLTRLGRGASVACVDIEDAPSFAVRGVMLDVSRDRVPTMAHLKSTIDTLAGLKINHLQLYTEHTFAYAGHEEAWAGASPITPAEARELDAYGAARGVEIAPNQNCFGHLARWLRLERYAPLAEIEGDGAWMFLHFERRGPFSLCPIVPGSRALAADLLGQLSACFRSNLVNIGCDETFDVGFGRSRGAVEKRAAELGGGERALSAARAELFFEFVAELGAICRGLGKRPLMWADIALSHPEMLDRLPAEAVGLAWWYEPTDKFGPWVRTIRESGHEAWVCPGTSSWRSFTGRTAERRGNIADAAEQGVAAGATGWLVCDWGDVGHRQQWPVSLIGLAHGAHAGWNAGAARTFDARAAAVHALGDPTGTVGPWLEALGDADRPIREMVKLTNATALFNDLHPPVPALVKPGTRAIRADMDAWRPVRETLGALQASMPHVGDPLMARELRHTLRVATFAADHAIGHRRPGGLGATDRQRLRDELAAIVGEHEELWLTRSRPGGLANASGFYRTVLSELDQAAG